MSLKIIIIGGGIGGTAAALALLRASFDVRVYEQVPAKTEVGAGIQLSPNATRLLQRYGLGEALKLRGVRPDAIEVRRWQDGATLSLEPLGDTIEQSYGAPYYHIHRADLLSVLSSALPAGVLQTGRRCMGATQTDGGVRATFEDGSHVEGDVLVGADGIHSTVRRVLFGEERPRFSGNIPIAVWRRQSGLRILACAATRPIGWDPAGTSSTTSLRAENCSTSSR
jgi:salicylate hydroxylase